MPRPATRSDALRLYDGADEVLPLSWYGTAPGVRILAASAANLDGARTGKGVLSCASERLRWAAPGGTPGDPVDVSADGDYLLEDGSDPDKWLRVNVDASELYRGAGVRVELERVRNNSVSQDDVTAAEATAGDVLTWTLTLTNDSPQEVRDVTAWLDAETVTDGLVEISDDGITYVSPNAEGHGDALTWTSIAASGSETLYFRRTITAGASADSYLLVYPRWSFTGA